MTKSTSSSVVSAPAGDDATTTIHGGNTYMEHLATVAPVLLVAGFFLAVILPLADALERGAVGRALAVLLGQDVDGVDPVDDYEDADGDADITGELRPIEVAG